MFFTRPSRNLQQLADTLARCQLAQVEANPQWFAKYEEYCGAKGVEAVRATPGYAKLYQTMQSLFMTILTPGLPTSDIAERMAKTHQRIDIKFEWFLAACQNLEDEMRKLKVHSLHMDRFRVFVRQVAQHYERALEAARQEALAAMDELKNCLPSSVSSPMLFRNRRMNWPRPNGIWPIASGAMPAALKKFPLFLKRWTQHSTTCRTTRKKP